MGLILVSIILIAVFIVFFFISKDGLKQVRADFAALGNRHDDVYAKKDVYKDICAVFTESIAWTSYHPHTYSLLTSHRNSLLAKLYLTSHGDLIGGEISEGRIAVEAKGLLGHDLSIRRVLTSIEVATVHRYRNDIELPNHLQYHCTWKGFLNGTWLLLDATGKTVFSVVPEGKIITVRSRAHILPDFPLLLILGSYLMIYSLDYSDGDNA